MLIFTVVQLQFQQVLWSVSGLINASHTLRSRSADRKNPGSSNTYIFVDAFDVWVLSPGCRCIPDIYGLDPILDRTGMQGDFDGGY